jgi:hypothetical protein
MDGKEKKKMSKLLIYVIDVTDYHGHTSHHLVVAHSKKEALNHLFTSDSMTNEDTVEDYTRYEFRQTINPDHMQSGANWRIY